MKLITNIILAMALLNPVILFADTLGCPDYGWAVSQSQSVKPGDKFGSWRLEHASLPNPGSWQMAKYYFGSSASTDIACYASTDVGGPEIRTENGFTYSQCTLYGKTLDKADGWRDIDLGSVPPWLNCTK